MTKPPCDYVYIMLWNVMPEKEKEKNYLKEAFNALGDAFSPSSPDKYAELRIKYAYFYRHFTVSCYGVKASWELFKYYRFDNGQKLSICCLGGGSGSELVGFMIWLRSMKIKLQIESFILDTVDWTKDSNLIMRLVDMQGEYNLKNCTYIRFNFCQKQIYEEAEECIANADLLTINKFLCAVEADADQTLNQLKEIFNRMKMGSMVFFMDKNKGDLLNIVEKVANATGFYCLGQIRNVVVHLPLEEIDSMISHGHDFPIVPETRVTIIAGLWKKLDL